MIRAIDLTDENCHQHVMRSLTASADSLAQAAAIQLLHVHSFTGLVQIRSEQ